MKFLPPRLSIMEGLQLFHGPQPDFNSRSNKLSMNSKEKGPPPHAQTTLASTYTHRPVSRVRYRPIPTEHTPPEAKAPKYIMRLIVHAWWQMFLAAFIFFTDTAIPSVCSAQLQPGLTALSKTDITASPSERVSCALTANKNNMCSTSRACWTL